MKYRPEVDGLRALAVVPVILFHAGSTLFSGGFIGVDIFFVISGYLITTIILSELEAGHFSLINFYERRARRILPALFVVLFTSMLGAWFLLSALDGAKFASSVFGVITFTSNFVFWLDEGYFESASELKPLLHTWSLAVEEQYYLFFPLFLMAAFRIARKYVMLILITVGLLSFALTQWAIILSAERASIVSAGFFLLPTRAWELLVGSLVAFHLTRPNAALRQHGKRLHQVLSLAGIAMILCAIFAFDEHTPFPSHFALLPTVGTALIILYATAGTFAQTVLSNRILVVIGLASYSAYLWHQPVMAFYRYQQSSMSIAPLALVALLGLIALLAGLTWRYIEQPFRNRTTFGRRVIFSYSASASVIAGLLAGIFWVATAQSERRLAHALSQNEFVYFGNMDERQFVLNRLDYDNNSPEALLMGSSRLMDVGSEIVGREALNLSVSGASVEDMVALLPRGLARYDVSDIYIGADPWLFNEDAGQDRWRSIEGIYAQSLASFDGTSVDAVQEIVSETGGFSKMIQELYYGSNLSHPVALDGVPSTQSKKSMDGVHIYAVDYLNKSPAEIAAEFDGLLNYSMDRYVFSPARKAIFENMLKAMQGYNIRLVLSPYHPDLYARMKAQRPVFLEIETMFRALAEQQGIAVMGSYDPEVVGCGVEDFYDGMHPNSTCMRKLFVTAE